MAHFLRDTPFAYLRSDRGTLPHDEAQALTGRLEAAAEARARVRARVRATSRRIGGPR